MNEDEYDEYTPTNNELATKEQLERLRAKLTGDDTIVHHTSAGGANNSIGLFQQNSPGFPSITANDLYVRTRKVANRDDIIGDALEAHRKEIDRANNRIRTLEMEVQELKAIVRALNTTVNRRPVPKKKGEA